MKFDPAKWAIVGFKDATGLGRQACDCRAVLGLGWHFVKPSERLETLPLEGQCEVLLDDQLDDSFLDDLVSSVDGLIFLESPFAHEKLLRAAERLKKPRILVPNWEWFPLLRRRQCRRFNLFVAPTRYTAEWLHRFRYGPSVVIPPPVDLKALPSRDLTGVPREFVHNAGLIDENDRKGTRATIAAFRTLKNGEARLLVRAQKPNRVLEDIGKDPRITVEVGNLKDHSELYWKGDVCVQPSRMEGIGFQIVEGLLSGMPVVTTDYPPMNEWVTDKRLLCDASWGFHLPKTLRASTLQAHLKCPSIKHLALKLERLMDVELSELAENARNLRTKTFSVEKILEQYDSAVREWL